MKKSIAEYNSASMEHLGVPSCPRRAEYYEVKEYTFNLALIRFFVFLTPNNHKSPHRIVWLLHITELCHSNLLHNHPRPDFTCRWEPQDQAFIGATRSSSPKGCVLTLAWYISKTTFNRLVLITLLQLSGSLSTQPKEKTSWSSIPAFIRPTLLLPGYAVLRVTWCNPEDNLIV